jgi:hypothetical protein
LTLAFSYIAPTSEIQFFTDYYNTTPMTISLTINGITLTQSGSGNVVENTQTNYANFQMALASSQLCFSFGTTTPVVPGDLETQAGLNGYLAGATIGQFNPPGDGSMAFVVTSVSTAAAAPEPASLSILVMGISAAVAARWRKKA